MKRVSIKTLCWLAGMGLSLLSGLARAETNSAAATASDTPSQQASTPAQQQDTVNINTASARELAERLSNVGPTRAEAIVTYREEHGPFTRIEQLLDVPGIGPGLLERNQARLAL